LGILGIAFRSIIRSPRRSLTLGIGVILAITLIVGAFLTADYMGQAILADVLKDVKVDIEVSMQHKSVLDYKNVTEELEKIEEINIVEPYVSGYLSYWNYNITKNGQIIWPEYINVTEYGENISRPYYDHDVYVYGFRQNISIGEIVVLEGNLNLTGENIAITQDFAQDLKLNVNDIITFTYVSWHGEERKIVEINATICAIIDIKGTLKEAMKERYFYPYFTYFVSPYYYMAPYYREEEKSYIITSIEFAQQLGIMMYEYRYYYEPAPIIPSKASQELSSPIYIKYWIFVDRDKLINLWDIEQTLDNLKKLEIKIENICIKYSMYSTEYSIENRLDDAINSSRFAVDYLKYTFGFNSLPVLFLAWFFALTASWISVNERRREIGLLKVRGATNKQIFRIILIEAVITGVLAGIIGAIIGFFNSLYLINIFAKGFTEVLIPIEVFTKLMPFYLELSIILGCLLALFAVFIPARRVANMPLEKLLQEYLEEIEAEKWKPRLTWIMFILGLAKTVEMILGFSVMKILWQMGPQTMPNIFIILVLIAASFIDNILNYLGPIFFIYGFSKIVTHYVSKFQKFFKSIVKPLLGELSDIAVKNFARKSTRTARVMFLIAITLTFGITMTIISNSSIQYNIKMIELGVGADINANPVYPSNETQLLENLSKIEGINLISTIRKQYIDAKGFYSDLVIVDENYFNVSFIGKGYLEGITIEEAYSKFKSGENCCIISRYLSEEYEYGIGDEMIVSFQVGEKTIRISLTIIAVGKAFPGVGYYGNIILISYRCVEKLFNPQEIRSIQLLIDVKENANSTKIAEELREKYEEIYSVVSFEEVVQQSMRSPLLSVYPKFYSIEFAFALLIAVIGLSLIMIMAALEREREIGLLAARGVNKKQVIKVFLGEVILIIVISYLIGIVEGFAVAYGYVKAFMYPLWLELPFKIPIVVPTSLYLMLIGGLMAFIIASVGPAWYITRKRVAEILRIHH